MPYFFGTDTGEEHKEKLIAHRGFRWQYQRLNVIAEKAGLYYSLLVASSLHKPREH